MKIKKLIVKNFKSFKDNKFEFKDLNIIEGRNGVGKSSILEAITYALLNTTPFNSSDTSKYIRNGESDMNVSIDVEGLGVVSRSFLGNKTNLTFNNTKESSRGFEDRYLVKSDYLLTAINPNYWLSLGFNERREIVLNLIPEIDRKKIFLDLYKCKDLLDRFMIEEYRDINAKLRATEGVIKDLEGKLSQMGMEVVDLQSFRVSNISNEIINEYQILEGKVKKGSAYNSDYNKLVEEKNKIENSNNELIEARKSLKQVIEDIKDDRISVSNITSNRNKIIKSIGGEDMMTVIRIKRESVSNSIKSIEKSKDKCPLCGSKFDTKKMIKELMKKYDELGDKLAKVSVNDEMIKSLGDKINKIKNNLEVNKRLRHEVITKIADLSKVTRKKVSLINEKIKEIEGKMVKDSELKRFWDLKDKYEKYKGNVVIMTDRRNRIDKLKKGAKALKLLIQENYKELEDLKVLSQALSPRGVSAEIVKIKTELFEKLVSRYASGVKIKTIENLKSVDGVKQVFNVFKRGVRESQLSTGEKMKLSVAFSLAISDLIKRKYNKNINFLFIDDASLITDTSVIEKIIGKRQIFIVKNTSEDNLKLN